MFERPGPLDFVAIARETLAQWDRERVFARLVAQNRGGPRFSFLDGPITANNPMGVHHARGPHVQGRLPALQGDVRLRPALPERLRLPGPLGRGRGGERARAERQARHRGDGARGLRARVPRARASASPRTRPSSPPARPVDGLGRSYYTMSDDNIAHIWHFLRRCHERGWIVRGHRVMPWCIRAAARRSRSTRCSSRTWS